MAQSVENLKTGRAPEASCASLRQELRTARRIQKAMLPCRLPRIPGLRIEAFYHPAAEVGGDLYDFIRIDRTNWGILIADAPGHGVPAALIGAMAKMAFVAHAARSFSSRDVMQNVNDALFHNLKMEYYVSAAYYIYDAGLERLTYSRAGHPEGLRLDGRTGHIMALGGSGFFLGLMKDGAFEQQSVAFRKGDRLFLYTDGIFDESAGGAGRFNLPRIKSLLRGTRRLPLWSVKQRILRGMKKGTRQGRDDAMFILLEAAR